MSAPPTGSVTFGTTPSAETPTTVPAPGDNPDSTTAGRTSGTTANPPNQAELTTLLSNMLNITSNGSGDINNVPPEQRF
ncbi:unnamed protein product [Schistosoma margrebowiei]|uniref:Uncharacterized protein n=1 Tax=Schistosoma margrebowiei TaxID=48269 RepID=A0AA84ZEF3_9TREM|nr:unnamed protein product [Schistosoma margrebowiei]